MSRAEAESNATVFDRDAEQYTRILQLQRPEQVFLRRFRERWMQIDMVWEPGGPLTLSPPWQGATWASIMPRG
jgi:hypothetical protein